MNFYIKLFFSFFFLIELSPIFWFFIDNNVNSHYLFIFEFVFFILLNYFFSNSKNILNFDLIYNYFLFFIKKPNFIFNYFLNFFKKIFIYLFFFKYKNLVFVIFIILKDLLSNFFIWWRPLFKKSSYFGYYRSNRSKWIK